MPKASSSLLVVLSWVYMSSCLCDATDHERTSLLTIPNHLKISLLLFQESNVDHLNT
jgi:hypothetical protein